MSAGQPPINSPEIRRLEPVLGPGHTYRSITDKISSIVLTRPVSLGWLAGFGICFCFIMLLNLAIVYLIGKGVGIWGINIPIGWGFAIVNFVWWIGIGHAGTLISAILFLLNQKWRTSINRFAEAMTLFAVMCAGLFPLLHMGRPWYFFWMFPYPATMQIWPQFRSPLIWDVFAVSTYFTVSLLFVIAPYRSRRPSFTECWLWAGAVPRGTGNAISPRTCCWRAWLRLWCSLFTPW
jgi:Ni/Fe-hydrogenase subunit HybB-like protein